MPERTSTLGQHGMDIRPLASTLARTAEDLVRALPVDGIFLCLPDPGGRTASLHPLYEAEESFTGSEPQTLTLAGSLADEITSAQRPVILERPFPDPFQALEMCLSPTIRSVILVPLETGGQVLGTLITASRRRSIYNDGHLEAIRPLVSPLAQAVAEQISKLT